jgi:hypothetical protein
MKNPLVENGIARFRYSVLSLAAGVTLAMGAVISFSATSFADENGVSFWLPGLFGSLAAVPQYQPDHDRFWRFVPGGHHPVEQRCE